MFILVILNLAVASIPNQISDLTSRESKLKSGLIYRAIRMGEQNHLAQRVGIEALGIDLPTVVCEFFLRGYKSALGAGVRISLFILNSLIIPTLIIPILGGIANKKFSLPKEFKKNFLNQFAELTPENKTKEGNERFIGSMKKFESEESIKSKFYNEDGSINDKAIEDFKERILQAKSFVMRWDIQVSGLLTYIVPWCQNFFEQKVLGLIGFSGEDKFLESSQKEESMDFHNKFKYVKFIAGIFPTVFGSHYFSKTVEGAVRTEDEKIKESKIKGFIKKHIKQFDYHKGIFANKLNLAGIIFFGGDAGMLFAARTIGEFTERIVRLSVFWPSFVYGIEWLHSKFAEKSDKSNGTRLIDLNEPQEFGIKRVRSLNTLEEDFAQAIKDQNPEKAEVALKSMEKGEGAFTKAFFGNSFALGVMLNIIAYIFTRIRIARGIY